MSATAIHQKEHFNKVPSSFEEGGKCNCVTQLIILPRVNKVSSRYIEHCEKDPYLLLNSKSQIFEDEPEKYEKEQETK